ncbi:hypothetical protein [Sphingobium sp. B2]|uniref:hypothetical protein n=1 Tax=Sphingobium sp. B2 TaxID=2583228 RepID=UPI0011A58217|nr:hypothetical protein [Sphingobium sp. B2]
MSEPAADNPMIVMADDRWEVGSHYSLPDLAPTYARNGDEPSLTDRLGAVAVGSGRIALGCLLAHGVTRHGWRRLWVPSYFCEDVIGYLADAPVAVTRYACGPWGQDETPEGAPGDVLLRVNYFGWGVPSLPCPFAGAVIEDHTHNPLGGLDSRADFALASLRKVMPLADGGLYWSPVGYDVPPPPPPSTAHEEAVLHKLAAMALKRAWLQGAGNDPVVDKDRLRQMELRGEEELLRGIPAPISDWSRLWLDRLSSDRMGHVRARNHAALRAALAGAGLRMLGPESPATPAIAVLALPTQRQRDVLRAGLIASGIYPAVLWPIPGRADGHPDPAHQFSASVLMLPVDYRYTGDDMRRVAATIRNLLDEISTCL